MAIPLNMGGSCSVCVPLYITKRSEAVLQWGEQKKYQKRVYRESKLWRNYREKNAASCYINFQVIY
jgi:hypothetical protein